MSDYSIFSDFYDEYKHYMTSDEQRVFNDFFARYPSERHFDVWLSVYEFDEDEKLDLYESFINATDNLPHIDDIPIKANLSYTPLNQFNSLKAYIHKGLLDEMVNDIKDRTHIKPISYPKPNISETVERIYPAKPTVRKRRMQWGGKPNYRSNNFSPVKSKGYALRSMKRHLPKINLISIKEVKEKMKRSISHIPIKADVTPVETQKLRMELDLFSAYDQFARYLFEVEQENTSSKKDAWDVAMPSGALDDFIVDNYAPTVRAFAELPSEIRAFIAQEWNKYNENARKGREKAYGYNLSKEQVDSLQDADLSYLREMM